MSKSLYAPLLQPHAVAERNLGSRTSSSPVYIASDTGSLNALYIMHMHVVPRRMCGRRGPDLDSTSTTFNFYTGLKFGSKKNFYGRVAAEANFSDLFSALLRPRSGRRDF